MPELRIVGLIGLAGTGKSSVAEVLQATQGVELVAFAGPLYAMAAIKQKTEGARRADRIRYGIHEILAEIFGPPLSSEDPSYSDLIGLVERITELPITPEDTKPRQFLQEAGDLLRWQRPDVLLQWIRSRILRAAGKNMGWDGVARVCVTDVRLEEEVHYLTDTMKAHMVQLWCPEEIRQARLSERGETSGDGKGREWGSHPTEKQVTTIDESLIAAKINSAEKSPQQIADFILDEVGLGRLDSPAVDEAPQGGDAQ